MEDEALSDLESVPPPAAGHAVPVAAAQGAANGPQVPQHPLWERAAGRGGGGGGGANKNGPGVATSHGRFCPISMAALEQRARNEFDGASSVGARTAHARHTTKDVPRRDEGDEEAPRGKKKQRVKDFDEAPEEDDDDALSEAASGADVVAGAAFGGGGKKNSCHTLSIASDTDDGASVTSSRAREAHCRAFPIPNETCVGCALPAKVGPVDDFVRANCDKMKEDALFKMAALVYLQKVVDPAEAEQVPVPVRRRTLLKPPTCTSADACCCLLAIDVAVEGHPVALHDAPHGRQDAALRKHAHARGHAQDARAVASQGGRGLGRQPRAHAGQGQCRANHEDYHAAVARDFAAARGGWLEQQARGQEARLARV